MRWSLEPWLAHREAAIIETVFQSANTMPWGDEFLRVFLVEDLPAAAHSGHREPRRTSSGVKLAG